MIAIVEVREAAAGDRAELHHNGIGQGGGQVLPAVASALLSFCIINSFKAMKKLCVRFICAAAMLSLVYCSNEGIKERPDDIEATGERLEIFQKIMAQFPEHKNVKNTQQALFENGAAKQVVLTSESAVYVTYISEGASFGNTFGWYSYNVNEKPSQRSDIELHVLFPHVSNRILRQGDRLQIGDGKFPAGTVIGFFLIIDGWEQGTIHYDRETFYTDFALNTDAQQQHVLFQQKELGDIVLTFEDELTSHESDQDFNDIIFTVTDNKDNQAVTRFDLTNVVGL